MNTFKVYKYILHKRSFIYNPCMFCSKYIMLKTPKLVIVEDWNKVECPNVLIEDWELEEGGE